MLCLYAQDTQFKFKALKFSLKQECFEQEKLTGFVTIYWKWSRIDVLEIRD
jgi:hypothetical protein